jgi:AhpC/TSA family protein
MRKITLDGYFRVYRSLILGLAIYAEACSAIFLKDVVLWLHSVGRKFMHRIRSGVLAASLLAAMTTGLFAQAKKEAAPMPKVGDMAPDFALKYATGDDLKEVKLSDFRGKKNVVLAFYVFAFTGG